MLSISAPISINLLSRLLYNIHLRECLNSTEVSLLYIKIRTGFKTYI